MKILVVDMGLSVSHAQHLAAEGNEVYYWTPWQTSNPKFNDFAIGSGFKGIQNVLYMWDYVDKVDMIVFFDVGSGDLVQYLRDRGYVVFGNGRKGEELEQNRWNLKQVMEMVGLPVQETVRVYGVSELRKYLAKHENKIVKADIFRGTDGLESFKAESLDKVELHIDCIESALGPYKETYQFIVEDFIEGAEPGFDLFFNGKKFITPYLWGKEFHKSAYLGVFSDELPKPIKIVADKLAPYLRSIDYRGAISTEMRVTKDGKPYLIDVCARLPFPLSGAYSLAISNYTELIYKVAMGEDVTIKNNAKYIFSLPLEAKDEEKKWLRVDYDKSIENNIQFEVATKVDGIVYTVPSTNPVLTLNAIGNTIEEAKNAVEKMIDKVDCEGLNKDISLDPMFKEIKEEAKYGIVF